MKNLFILTIADMISERIVNTYPRCHINSIKECDKSQKIWIPFKNLLGLTGKIKLEISYFPGFQFFSLPLSRRQRHLLYSVNFFNFPKASILPDSDLREPAKPLEREIMSVSLNHELYVNYVMDHIHEATSKIDFLGSDWFGPTAKQRLLVIKSRQLALQAFEEGPHAAERLEISVQRLNRYMKSRPTTDRNIVYGIFFALLEVNLTTDQNKKKQKLTELKQSLIRELEDRLRANHPNLPDNPMDRFESESRSDKEVLACDHFVSEASFKTLLKGMKID